ncbi:MAG TPA: 4-hydroxybenzoate 3-monooxygenase [Polyangia bacterium]|nr:4-hydroxybenzoate 3-monooxygenase [Polyangia bacterium]
MSDIPRSTQVAIIGAGPAGLVLSHLLARAGIQSIVLENRTRVHVERRVRAGVLEQGTVELLDELGLSDRLHREGLVHHGVLLTFGGRRHRIALSDLTGGRSITIYGQQELVKDLIGARLTAGGAIEFEVEEVSLSDLESARPRVRFRKDGVVHELACDFIAGCDGFHGVSRPSIPPGVLSVYERAYPFAWLGILAAVPPSTDELIYARHPRGFALHSLRSSQISRLYIQVDPGEQLDNWSDDRIWQELRARLATDDGWALRDGPVLERGIALHHSFVVEPMQHGRLFLAGDAAHIVPPTGAKGLNLAVADVRVLARAIGTWYASGATAALDDYSARCLARVWRVQEFSSWMSTLLHPLPDATPFDERLSQARLEWICKSEAASRSLAENYVGLPFE